MPTAAKPATKLSARLTALAKLASPAPNRGATEAKIVAAERRLRRKFPPIYRAFLSIHDGWKEAADAVTLLSAAKLKKSAEPQDDDDSVPAGWVLVGFQLEEDTQYFLRPKKPDTWSLVEVHHDGLVGARDFFSILDVIERSAKAAAVVAEPRSRLSRASESNELQALLDAADLSSSAVAKIVALIRDGKWHRNATIPIFGVVTKLVAKRRLKDAELLLSTALPRLEGLRTWNAANAIEPLLPALYAAKLNTELDRCCTELLRIDKFYSYYYHRGLAKMDLGDLPGAIADYRSSIALNSTSFANNNLAYCLYRLGRYEEAKKFAETAIKRGKNNREAHRTLRDILAALGDK